MSGPQTLKTCVAESDGTNCPRGWYLLVTGTALNGAVSLGTPTHNFSQNGEQVVAFGPYSQAQAIAVQRRFLGLAGVPEPRYPASETPVRAISPSATAKRLAQ